MLCNGTRPSLSLHRTGAVLICGHVSLCYVARLGTHFTRLIQRLEDSTRPLRRKLRRVLEANVDVAGLCTRSDGCANEYRQVNAATEFQRWFTQECLGLAHVPLPAAAIACVDDPSSLVDSIFVIS